MTARFLGLGIALGTGIAAAVFGTYVGMGRSVAMGIALGALIGLRLTARGRRIPLSEPPVKPQ